MTSTRDRLFLIIATAVSLAAFIFFTVQDHLLLDQHLLAILVFAVIGVVAESQSLAIDDEKALSISFSVNICTLLLFGIGSAVWVSLCTALFAVIERDGGKKSHLFNTPFNKSALNAANYVLSIVATGLVYQLLGGQFLQSLELGSVGETFAFLSRSMPAIIAGVIAYVLVNTGFVMLYFSITAGKFRGLLRQWLGILRWSLLSMAVIGTLGVLLTGIYNSLGMIVLLLVFGPFLLLRYIYAGITNIQKSYLDTIRAFTAALEAKDKSTEGHARRVGRFCELIGQEMKLSSDRMKVLRFGSLLHDIGKIGIPESILNKEGQLSDEEMEQMRQHPLIGAKMLEGISFLKDEVRIIRGHHIHFDGKGYPQEAIADAQMVETRILSVADAFDAMTSSRTYRTPMSPVAAVAELRRVSGSQFDPRVVESLVQALERLPDGIDAAREI